MDTSGFDQVGRYGTLSLLKAGNVTSGESSVVTSFGVDTAPLTFGSATTCDVRLYYPDVEKLHCKIVFNEERKAFLTIIGVSGVNIDGCQVYPHTSSVTNSTIVAQDTPQTIIPLTNHSIFQIHGKRFQFSYPPKEARKAIFDTPPQQKRRALRLSMINSAEVFSPRPSKDPRENLRILQSPLKSAFMKSPSKLRLQSPGSRLPAPQFEDEEEEEEIVLVETNYPRVVEEEKDLIILEDAPLPLPRTQVPVQPPVTPRRRSLASNALHRAVLIRSAQRAVVRAERVREEEEDLEEEAEVFGTVLEEDEDIIGDDEGLEDDDEIQDVHMRSPGEAGGDRSEDGSTDDEEDEDEGQPPTEQQKSLWRKSLERMWPFRSSSPERPPDGNDNQRVHPYQDRSDSDDDDSDEEEVQTDDAVASLPNRKIASTPIRRALGTFMTPQHQATQSQTRIFPVGGGSQAGAGASTGRFSLGGGEARRVVVQRPWKVKDLVVPSAPDAPSAVASPMRPPSALVQNILVNSTPKLTLEEKKAIQERRRSAVRQPDNFFSGGIPGMSPNKASSSTPTAAGTNSWRASASPVKPNLGSPTKGQPLEAAISEQDEKEISHSSRDSDEDPLDTQVLMERMKNTVEDLKRRKSTAAGGSTPQFPAPSLVHPKTEIRPGASVARVNMAPRLSVGVGVPSLGPIRKLDFSGVSTTPIRKTYKVPHITPKPVVSTPSANLPPPMEVIVDDKSDSEDSRSPQQSELPAFSLLRPAAREEAESRRSSGGGQISPPHVERKEETVEEETTSAKRVPLPELVVEDESDVQMESDEEVPEPSVKAPSPKKTRSRLLRPTKEEVIKIPLEDVEEPVQPVRKPSSRSRSKPPTNLAVPATRTRSKSPQPPQEAELPEDVTPAQPPTTRAKPPSKSKTPSTTRRIRKVATTPNPEKAENEEELQTPTTTAGRRGRNTRVDAPETVEEQPEPGLEGEPEAEPEPEPAAPKRGRPKKPVSTEVKSKIPAAKPATKSRSLVRQVLEDPEDEDPLDSYDVNGETEEAEALVPAPAARSRTTKIPASSSRTRTTKKIVKQEEDAQPEPTALAPAKTSRSTRVNTATTPAVGAAATKGRKLRTPATAPAATIVDKGKENMSGSGSGSDLVGEAEEGLAKVRVSRTRGTTKKVSAKTEEVPAEIPDAPVKTTRAKAAGTSRTARTRTKTG